MIQATECIGIIPARYHSSRFPGKPLADILGKPMFWHVYQRARRCRMFSRVVLATDDDRIESAARSLHVPTLMTRRDHQSGTDRVMEAAELLQASAEALIVNIQGDEPALATEMVDEILSPFEDPAVEVTTLAREITPAEARNPDRVKVVFSRSRRALYFSRSPIPFMRGTGGPGHFGHVGMYAFRFATLKRFVSLEASALEKVEHLEQLRLLENDIPVHVAITRHRGIGVDRPADLPLAVEMIRENPFTP